MKILLSFVFIAIIGQKISAQTNEFYNQKLINDILRDTVVDDNSYKEKIRELVTVMHQDKGDKSKMFPFSEYDSVIAYKFNKKYFHSEDSKEMERVFYKGKIRKDLNLVNGYKLNENQIEKLLGFINNPCNFSWAECGTPITFGLIVFYRKQEMKAIIQLSCGFNQIDCFPINKRTKLGKVTDEKAVWLDIFVEEINIKYGW